jgi:hypothetical protein
MSKAIHATNGRQPIIVGTKLNGAGFPTSPSVFHQRAGNDRKTATANTPGIRRIKQTAQQLNTSSYQTVQGPASGVKPGAKYSLTGETH